MACNHPLEERVPLETVEPYERFRCTVCERTWWTYLDEDGHLIEVEG